MHRSEGHDPVQLDWPAATFLGRLRPPTRELLLRVGTAVEYPANRVILRQGDEERHVVLLLDGLVKVTSSAGDQETLLAIRVGGDVIGEMAVLERRPRSASVVASVPVRARIIHPGELELFLERCPDAALELMRMMSERLRWSNRRRMDFAACTPAQRLSRIIIEVARVYGKPAPEGWDLGVPLTQAELASLAGVGLRSAEKALHQMVRDDMILCLYRRMVIRDVDRLGDLARIE